MTAPKALEGLRVLDLAGPFGNYAGKMFAGLGADVILVEPPQGAPSRGIGPFLDDRPGPDRSIRFAYENLGQRGIVLDLETAEGRDAFLDLAAASDLVLESFGPGELERLGLTGDVLRQRNPALVLSRLSAFGQTGPFAQYKAEDLTLLAMGGLLFLGGYPGEAPVAAGGGQAVLCGNLFAAVACMVALTGAEMTGEGQDIDTSIQESVVMALENAVQFYDLEGTVRQRYAGDQRQAGAGTFDCADGQVYLLAGGVAATKFWINTRQWMADVGADGAEVLFGDEWFGIPFLRTRGAKDQFRRTFESYARSQTRAELYAEAQRRRVPLAPVNGPADLKDNKQLQFRDFFVSVANALPGTDLLMPGAPYRLEATPWVAGDPAPALGEHTEEVLATLAGAADQPTRRAKA